MESKLITLIDMDCFYCQVEVRLNPRLRGKPVAVVQYNKWKGGGIIAVNYEARDLGVTRFMRGAEAQKKCPQIELVSVPEVRGKADLSKYREAGREVIAVLSEFCSCIEKASIDEAYLDITNLVKTKISVERITRDKLKNTFVIGYDDSHQDGIKHWLDDIDSGGINDSYLAYAAVLVEEIRATVLARTGFHCSAGIAHNKTLAKLACGMHKPNRQTVLPPSGVPILYAKLPVKKIKKLGGKFGNLVHESLGAETIGDVSKYTLKELQNKFGDKSGLWLFNIARGIDDEPVKVRTISKSIGCCKNFKGLAALATKDEVKHWLSELCTEIHERIQEDLITNKRKATLLVISAQENIKGSSVISKSTSLNSYDFEDMLRVSLLLLNKLKYSEPDSPLWEPPLKFLGLSVGKFIPTDLCKPLLNFFKPQRTMKHSDNDSEDPLVTDLNLSSAFTKKESLTCTRPAVIDNLSDNADNGHSGENTTTSGEHSDISDYHGSFFCEYFDKKIISAADVAKNLVCGIDVKPTYEGQAGEYFTSSNRNSNSEHLAAADQNDDCVIQNTVPPVSSENNYDNENCILQETNQNSVHAVIKEETKKGTIDLAKESALHEYCVTCQQYIVLEDMLMHLDYHTACDLHEKLNIPLTAAENENLKHPTEFFNRNATSTDPSKLTSKNRTKKSVENRFNPITKNRPITSFFPSKPQNK